MASIESQSNQEQIIYTQITEFIKQQKGVDGVNMYEHLYRLFHKLLREPNKFCNDMKFINLLSDFVKKSSFNYKDPLSDQEVNNIPLKIAVHQDWITKSEELFRIFIHKDVFIVI